MNQQIALSGPQIIDAFRTKCEDFKTLCERCGVTDFDSLERHEKAMTRNLEALSFGELVRKAVECGIVGFRN